MDLWLRVSVSLATIFISADAVTPAAIKLDNRTIDKWLAIPKLTTFVKFDQMYSYGMKEEEYIKLCESAHGIRNFYMAYVPVAQYGDQDNNDLRMKWGLVKEDFPAFYLFTPDNKAGIRYTGPVEDEHMNAWLRVRGIKLKPAGTIAALDDMVAKFLAGGMAEEHLIETRKLVEGPYDHNPKSFWYVQVMEKTKEKGLEYIGKELNRLEKVLKERADMHEDKFDDLFNKLQVLTVFHLKEEGDDLDQEEL